MAPSVAETTSNLANQIHEKVAAVSLKDHKESQPNVEDAPTPAVQAPEVQAPLAKGQLEDNQPETADGPAPIDQPTTTKIQHREPLKLSGALDSFESFDVTPVIGREFVDVNLADWLKAPNSDDLIRDLAITSKISSFKTFKSNEDKFPNEALCSSENKMISQMTYKSNWFRGLESYRENLPHLSFTSIQSLTPAVSSVVRMTRSV